MKTPLLIVLASLAVCASAQTKTAAAKPKDKAKPAAKMTCAVTHEKLDVAKATKDKMFADYKGRRYYFCCEGCPATFKKDPTKYAKTATSVVTPKK